MAKASTKKIKQTDDTIVGGWIQRDTPPQSAGPIRLFPNLRAADGTLLSDSKGRPIKHKKSTKAKKK